MNDLLLPLLRRIRDGHADADEVVRARELLRDDPRLDDELRSIALTDEDDLSGDAAGLLAVLGEDDLGPLLADAIAHEAGRRPDVPTRADNDVTIDEPIIDQATLDALPWAYGPAIAAAVRYEAGHIDVVMPVLLACDLREDQVEVERAVRREAGLIDIVSDVLVACGLAEPEVPVAEAVRDEAGTVEVAEQVIAWSQVDVSGAVRAAAGSVDVVGAVMAEVVPKLPSAVGAPADPLEPANDTRAFAFVGLLLAAAVALFVSLSGIGTGPSDGELPDMAFANADELVVEDLTYDPDLTLLEMQGQDGAIILWVDEET